MAVGLALLVSADSATIQQFSHALQDLSISPDVCREVPASIHLLNRRKFDAVIVDLQLGGQSGLILDEVRLSSSNRTAVTFAISGSDTEATAAFRKGSGFVFERPLSTQSIRSTLKHAYGLILRERRRYFRCPISIPVVILRRAKPEVRCNSVNVSEGGMALSTFVPLNPGEKVHVQFSLPDHKGPFSAESKICRFKSSRLGVRFVSLSLEHKSELQSWLSRKLEEMLPEFVARKFRKDEVVQAFIELYQNMVQREKDLKAADEVCKMLDQLHGAERLEAISEFARVVGEDYEQMSGFAREAFDWNLALLLLGRLQT